MALKNDLQSCTVRLTKYSNGRPLMHGTGFFMQLAAFNGRDVTAIVTNKHVIDGGDAVGFNLSHVDKVSGGDVKHEEFKVNLVAGSFFDHPDQTIDLCIVYFEGVVDELRKRGRRSTHSILPYEGCASQELLESFLPMDPVVMIGYPNGLWDHVNNGAIARRGILAASPKDNFQGRPDIVVDMACFHGSSGSPIFLFNDGFHSSPSGLVPADRCWLIGVLYSGPQVTAKGTVQVPNSAVNLSSETKLMINLGYAVKVTELGYFVQEAKRLLGQV